MPQYIKKAPWYVNNTEQDEALKHQRRANDQAASNIYESTRRETSGQLVTKFRKGACTNCGALTHQAKTCIERPRKLGAQFTGRDFGKDEVIREVQLGYAAKRDRWNGYNPDQYKQEVVETWRTVEDAKDQKKQELAAEKQKKRELKAIEKQSLLEQGKPPLVDSSESSDSDDDSDIDNGDQD